MREIKFRQAIFHPVTGGFLRWHYWGLIDGAFVGIDTGWYPPSKAIENSYQGTGLKDKNGKEIYEGDIIRLESGAVGQVEWDDDIDTDRYWWLASGFSIYIKEATGTPDMETLEVIGNIYENPELLEGLM